MINIFFRHTKSSINNCKIGIKFLQTMAEKPKVYVTRNVPLPAIEMLKEKCDVKQWTSDDAVPRDTLIKEVQTIDALFCLLTEKIDTDLLSHASKLKVIGTMSVGFDHIDVPACRKKGLKLGYTPEVLTEATAELTIALLLCTARRMIEASEEVRNGGWGTWGPMWMLGKGINNSTVGIVGLGRIGQSVARKIVPFLPKKILYYDVFKPPVADELGLVGVSFDELLAKSDFVVINCQLNEKTKHLFNKEAFGKMKKEAIVVNTSRGPVVDQDALYDALSTGQIRAAGLDVCTPEPLPADHKLLTLKNFVMLPHIASATEETRTRMATLTAENILAGLEETKMPAPIP